jgi:hypothetical protein
MAANTDTSLISFFLHLDNESRLVLLVLGIVLVYFFTTVIKVQLGHILGFFIIIFISYFYIESKKEDSILEDNELEFKLNYLSTHDYIPKNLYIDADIVILLYNIKTNFSEYNPDTYLSILKTCDNLLGIRKDFELELVDTPTIINLHQNFKVKDDDSDDQLNYSLTIDDTKNRKKSILKNAYANYTVAEEQLKLCMNELHSFIIKTPANEVMHFIHKESCDRMYILLKRNLDIIHDIYKKNKKIYDTNVFGYDSPEEYNKSTGINGITGQSDVVTSNFNFY